jgi:hypothetical protein
VSQRFSSDRRPLSLRGRDEIVSYLRDNLGPEIITVHRCGHRAGTICRYHRPPGLIYGGHYIAAHS